MYTDVEKTMIELQRTADRPETRGASRLLHNINSSPPSNGYQAAVAFISNHRVGPDIEIELFMLAPQ